MRRAIASRLAQGAQPEDYVFTRKGGGYYRPLQVEREWRDTLVALDLVKPRDVDPSTGEPVGEPVPLWTFYEARDTASRHACSRRATASTR